MSALHRLACVAVALCACGGTQPAAAPGNTAPDGKPITTLATAQGYPINIRGDGAGVFWTNHLGGQIMALAAGGAPKILADHQDYPLGIAVDKTDVYWTTLNGGTVVKVSRSGGKPVTLASGQFGPSGIALDDTNVYWTNTYAGTVMTVSKAGGKPSSLASKQATPAGIAVSGGVVYWTNRGTAPDYADGAVMRLARGDAPTAIASALADPQGIAADATAIPAGVACLDASTVGLPPALLTIMTEPP